MRGNAASVRASTAAGAAFSPSHSQVPIPPILCLSSLDRPDTLRPAHALRLRSPAILLAPPSGEQAHHIQQYQHPDQLCSCFATPVHRPRFGLALAVGRSPAPLTAAPTRSRQSPACPTSASPVRPAFTLQFSRTLPRPPRPSATPQQKRNNAHDTLVLLPCTRPDVACVLTRALGHPASTSLSYRKREARHGGVR
ncbi:hypothetical protein B0H19DRAFT_1263790 [Mycena capillaripes]|nr:hypothetical protein B0H19DRAFT_1263790 [Mycena capillaripes]